jgi:hypothetical protein
MRTSARPSRQTSAPRGPLVRGLACLARAALRASAPATPLRLPHLEVVVQPSRGRWGPESVRGRHLCCRLIDPGAHGGRAWPGRRRSRCGRATSRAIGFRSRATARRTPGRAVPRSCRYRGRRAGRRPRAGVARRRARGAPRCHPPGSRGPSPGPPGAGCPDRRWPAGAREEREEREEGEEGGGAGGWVKSDGMRHIERLRAYRMTTLLPGRATFCSLRPRSSLSLADTTVPSVVPGWSRRRGFELPDLPRTHRPGHVAAVRAHFEKQPQPSPPPAIDTARARALPWEGNVQAAIANDLVGQGAARERSHHVAVSRALGDRSPLHQARPSSSRRELRGRVDRPGSPRMTLSSRLRRSRMASKGNDAITSRGITATESPAPLDVVRRTLSVAPRSVFYRDRLPCRGRAGPSGAP